ncbi:MAG: methyltransferase domain-containing protein [Armatimonadota bacterium]|nr:methyltransferase domain-containing protein [Armatimonadota bacterium]
MDVDKDLARRRFSRAARSYNKWSKPQEHMAERLMSLLPEEKPKSVMEIGCGTGLLTGHLTGIFLDTLITAIDIAPGMIEQCKRELAGKSNVKYIVADAEELDLPERFDLIVSSSCFQWFSDIERTMRRLAAHLAPKGCLAFAAPVNGTLCELQSCYEKAAPGKKSGHALPEPESFLQAIINAGLRVERSEVETRIFTYGRPEDALESLRGIGATRAVRNGGPGLSRTQIGKMLESYKCDFSTEDGQVTCTYRTIYVRARI